jgi:hypothetical protein
LIVRFRGRVLGSSSLSLRCLDTDLLGLACLGYRWAGLLCLKAGLRRLAVQLLHYPVHQYGHQARSRGQYQPYTYFPSHN